MGNRKTSDPFRQELGKALKDARTAKGYSQSYVAQELGWTDSTSNALGRYENAHRTPDVQTLAALSVIYETPIDSLVSQAQNAASAVNQLKKDSKNG